MRTKNSNPNASVEVAFWTELKNHLLDLLLILLVYYVVSTRTISVSLSVDSPTVGWVQHQEQPVMMVDKGLMNQELSLP